MSLYTDERNAQILISLLKQNGIKYMVASPGTTNACFVASCQSDSFFEIYSAPEERSGAYIACGLAAETGCPVVLSCTGATASRNYMPALTEAYYRKLPILAITSSRRNAYIGHNYDQVTDRTQLPNDIAKISVQMPMVYDDVSEWECIIAANKAIAELTHNGGGPAHINLETSYSKMTVNELPLARYIKRYETFQDVPIIQNGAKVAVFVGSHLEWSKELTLAVDEFCEAYNAVVLCDHTSNYKGKYRLFANILSSQYYWKSSFRDVDIVMHIGDISTSDYHLNMKEVWRINPDGEMRDTFKKLKYVFECPEEEFFDRYCGLKEKKEGNSFFSKCKDEEKEILNNIPDLPFSNIWVARVTAPKLPNNAVLHLGIRNSLRSWNYFEASKPVLAFSNVGGFGIDGSISTAFGAALTNPQKLYYCVLGDLAFFYDISVLGNRHLPKNLRILLVNNGLGMEMKFSFSLGCQIAQSMSVDGETYVSAGGHYNNAIVVKHFVESFGCQYLSVSTKEEYQSALPVLLDKKITAPVVCELFITPENEDKAHNLICTIKQDKIRGTKQVIKGIIGDKATETLRNLKNGKRR